MLTAVFNIGMVQAPLPEKIEHIRDLGQLFWHYLDGFVNLIKRIYQWTFSPEKVVRHFNDLTLENFAYLSPAQLKGIQQIDMERFGKTRQHLIELAAIPSPNLVAFNRLSDALSRKQLKAVLLQHDCYGSDAGKEAALNRFLQLEWATDANDTLDVLMHPPCTQMAALQLSDRQFARCLPALRRRVEDNPNSIVYFTGLPPGRFHSLIEEFLPSLKVACLVGMVRSPDLSILPENRTTLLRWICRAQAANQIAWTMQTDIDRFSQDDICHFLYACSFENALHLARVRPQIVWRWFSDNWNEVRPKLIQHLAGCDKDQLEFFHRHYVADPLRTEYPAQRYFRDLFESHALARCAS